MRYMLDTNTCIYAMRQQSPYVARRIRRLRIGDLGMSTIVLSELQYGVTKSAQPQRNQAVLDAFVASLEIAVYDAQASVVYGPVRAELENHGQPIGPMDLLIAAHALSLGATLVTHNTREYNRVPGLRVEDWMRDR